MKQTMRSSLTNTKIIVINQLLRQLTLHSHTAIHAKSRAPDTSTQWNQATASLRRQLPKNSSLSLTFQCTTRISGHLPASPTEINTNVLLSHTTESRDSAPGASRARCELRFLSQLLPLPKRAPRAGSERALPGPRHRSRWAGRRAGAYITGQGDAVLAEGSGKGRQERERNRRGRRGTASGAAGNSSRWEQFAPPHAQTLRRFRPCPQRR